MFKNMMGYGTGLTQVLFSPVRWISSFYMVTLAIPLFATDRYIDTRPGDALLLIFLTGIMCIVLPLTLLLLWLFGASSTTILITGGVVFISPPLLTLAFLEYAIWKGPPSV